MGLEKPTADTACQTLTYRRLKETITDEFRDELEEQTAKRMQESNDIRAARLHKEIDILTEKNITLKEKVRDIQMKLGT